MAYDRCESLCESHKCIGGTSGKDYLLIVDYFSKYPEVLQTNSKTADMKMKSTFARHGIPNTVVADNMPFGSRAFQQFEWGFSIVTSSPTCAQSNGLAERNVHLDYSTPLEESS